MSEREVDRLDRALARWVALVLRHGGIVALVTVGLCVGAGVYALGHLGFNLDPNNLFSEDLRFQRQIRAFEANFPVLTNTLLVVVDGETPETTRAAADALQERLASRSSRFTEVFLPGEEAFFDSHGLLYAEIEDLETFADAMARLQPLIGALARDPSLGTLASVIELGLDHTPPGSADAERWVSILDHFRSATVAVYAEHPVNVSWETVLLSGTPLDPALRRVLVVVPLLDFDRVFAAERAVDAIRDEVAALGLEVDGVRVRVTGYPALNHEEFVGLARDTALAGTLAFALVVVVLFFAFRSWVMVTAAAVTLVLGLVGTAGHAALAVGRLNPASIGFAVLFIGLGIDFSIHLGMAMVEGLRKGLTVALSLVRAARVTGSALLLCGITTAIGFLAFLPTDYRGVSELGVIAAGAMLVIMFLTLTLFPVLVAWGLREGSVARLRRRRPFHLTIPGPRWPRTTVVVAALLAVAAAVLAPRAEVETNVIALRNPATESVTTYLELIEADASSPWYIDLVAPNLAEAVALAERVEALDTVSYAITLADFVPSEQAEKQEILADAALWLDLPSTGIVPVPPASAETTQVLRRLVGFLDDNASTHGSVSIGRSARMLRDELQLFLTRLAGDSDPRVALEALEEALVAPIPGQIVRLQRNLTVEPISLESLPPRIVSRLQASDGQARVQVFPAEQLGGRAEMVRFVESVRPLWPELTGLPVNLVESAYATSDSLKEALFWAFIAISTLLVLLWRRPVDAALALLPVALAVLCTAAASVVLARPLNFINVVVLPLLLGIGVDSGVHIVHRARSESAEEGGLLRSSSVQAVFYSALTTIASFGTLMLSEHRGLASLGELLVIGMGFMLLGNLVVLPAMLVLWQRRA